MDPQLTMVSPSKDNKVTLLTVNYSHAKRDEEAIIDEKEKDETCLMTFPQRVSVLARCLRNDCCPLFSEIEKKELIRDCLLVSS